MRFGMSYFRNAVFAACAVAPMLFGANAAVACERDAPVSTHHPTKCDLANESLRFVPYKGMHDERDEKGRRKRTIIEGTKFGTIGCYPYDVYGQGPRDCIVITSGTFKKAPRADKAYPVIKKSSAPQGKSECPPCGGKDGRAHETSVRPAGLKQPAPLTGLSWGSK